MKQHQLRALDAVARLGGIRAAARHMNLTQPALTKALRALETDMGVALLDRTNRGAGLTPAGQRLLIRSRAILREMEVAQMEMRQMAGEQGSRIAVGISPMLGESILADVCRRFRARFPNVRLKISEAFTYEAMNRVAEGAVDFALVLLLGTEAAANVNIEPWFDVDHKVVGRTGHPLGRRASFEDLWAQDWLITNTTRSGQFDLLARLCAENGRPLPPILHEVSSLTLLRTLVLNTDGVAIAPILGPQTENAAGQIIECDAVTGLHRQFGTLRRAGVLLSPAAEAMRDELHAACRRLLGPGAAVQR